MATTQRHRESTVDVLVAALVAACVYGCASKAAHDGRAVLQQAASLPTLFAPATTPPAGYSRVTGDLAQRLPAGAVAFAEDAREEADYFRGSIAVIPVPAGPEPSCAALGAQFTASGRGVVEHALTTGLPRTAICQLDGRASDKDTTRFVMTEFPAYGVTCNFDVRDEAALAGCRAYLAGW